MPPPPLSYGLNLATKKGTNGAPSQKRKKAIFDSDSDDETNNETGGIEISTLGGIEEPTTATTTSKPPRRHESDSDDRPAKRKVVPLGQGAKPKIKPLSKTSIFADDDDDDDHNGEKDGGRDGQQDRRAEKLNKGGTSYGLNDPANRAYTNLSAMHSSKKHASEAQDLDPSIYSYDAVYDSLHKKPEKKSGGAGEEGGGGGGGEVPRYMTSLLRSAEIRKRDQLRARDRMLAKEREAEGDEFADKEKFVTAAYKAQQEEMRRVEAEEAQREREEEERRRKNGGSGMVGFYRDLLSRGEQEHEAAMRAADEAARKIQETGETAAETESKEKTEAQIAAELNARGAHIAVNDEGQVVDKRQLLSAGLNVAPKPKQAPAAAGLTKMAAGIGAKSRFDSRQMGARAGQRARQTEMIAAQLEEQARQEEEAEAARQKEIAERSRSQKTAGDVSSARERYLARKKEREAAAKGS